MKINRRYNDADREKNDRDAVRDTKDYLSPQQYKILVELMENNVTPFSDIVNWFGFTGVNGYPVHAMGRKFCLAKYREWMAAGTEDCAPRLTDEAGFPIEKETTS